MITVPDSTVVEECSHTCERRSLTRRTPDPVDPFPFVSDN